VADTYPVHAIRADVGLGKSTEARRWCAIRLQELRASGDQRTIVFAVPTAKLGHEQVKKFHALPEACGLSARVRLGRERPDPEAPGQAMCRDLDAVADAQEAMVDVQTAVCRQRHADGSTRAECTHFSVCGYQRQRRARADLWFVAHENLFLKKPVEIGDPMLIIVDESPWDAGLIGHDGRHIVLPVDTVRHGETAIENAVLAAVRLRFLRTRLADALDVHSDGPLTRAALLAADFTSSNADEARALEWQRKIDVEMWPGMPRMDRKEAAQAAKANNIIWRLALLWRAVAALVAPDGPEASGWARLALDESEGGSVRVLRLKGRREVSERWRRPTLLIDAALQADLLRPF
jgi:putative DNA primase/helicase